MSSQAIDLRNIRKRFGPDEVLKGIDLSIRPGEFLSLVGMSGCGKSTLLRIIAGLESPDQGAVAIGGGEVTNVDPSDRNLAMVFQSYALYPHMSVRENIATPLRMRRLPMSARLPVVGGLFGTSKIRNAITEDVERAAGMLQIGHLLDRKPSQLSGGQRQRVALARAIVRSPAAFLMDEPLSNLDAKLRAHMREELVALHRRLGATFVYVTHDQIEALTMSDRIALMSEGRIEQLGTPDELYRQPATLTVARFIGSPSINLLPVDVDSAGEISAYGQALGLRTKGDTGPATLGLRSEDLFIATDGLSLHQGLAVKVLRSETHGADRYMTCQLLADPTVRLTVRQTATAKPGVASDGTVHLGFHAERAHLFGANDLRRPLTVRERVLA
ncbi:ABC transporter ATP-binding protein [Ferranicluibacter rubi]|uniref:ABC transporter ATP-binding protein n=1 Tax=Ferranicluibacter rubi TaxID=2715133 RepID=A0AA44CDL0_9HYPH|nr:ABC transporter ATP-binding protein [Ferranicluibacter rubi]NHT77072.1 ABC transporter ATP-binding protein [Ferranicluibacter rubi]TCQ20146.1 carbohydrate ABC transporter ATP-binding protein (CUT1 family) [Rhizobium sp. PP-CC-3G-465]